MLNTVLPLVTGLVLWFKADSITDIATNQSIAKWSDSSSSQLDAGVSDHRYEPTFQSHGLNGRATVRFQGNQFLKTPPMRFFHQPNDSLTVFVVFRANTVDRPSCLLDKPVSDPNLRFELAIDSGTQASGNIGIAQAGNNAVTTEAHVIFPGNFYILAASISSQGNTPENVSLSMNSSPLDLYQAGSGWLNSGGYPTEASSLWIGVREDLKEFFQGDIAEILVFSHQLSPPDLARVGCYLRKKYDISEASPWCAPVK